MNDGGLTIGAGGSGVVALVAEEPAETGVAMPAAAGSGSAAREDGRRDSQSVSSSSDSSEGRA